MTRNRYKYKIFKKQEKKVEEKIVNINVKECHDGLYVVATNDYGNEIQTILHISSNGVLCRYYGCSRFCDTDSGGRIKVAGIDC